MLTIRYPTVNDCELYYHWASDFEVRAQSYQSKPIVFEEHETWFKKKLEDKNCTMIIFQDDGKEVGQIRFEKLNGNEFVIGVSIGKEFRGKGYAKEILVLGSDHFINENPDRRIHAYIKEENLRSKYAFEKAGFKFVQMVNYEGFKSFHYIKCKHEDRNV